MTTTNIKTPYDRELIVEQDGGTYLEVKSADWDGKKSIKTFLPEEQVAKLANALLGESAVVITDLPEVELDSWGDLTAVGTGISRMKSTEPERILNQAKALLAIHTFLIKRNAEQEEAKKAEAEAVKAKEAANTKRRDELVTEIRGFGDYAGSSSIFQDAIDRIIDLEEAAKVS